MQISIEPFLSPWIIIMDYHACKFTFTAWHNTMSRKNLNVCSTFPNGVSTQILWVLLIMEKYVEICSFVKSLSMQNYKDMIEVSNWLSIWNLCWLITGMITHSIISVTRGSLVGLNTELAIIIIFNKWRSEEWMAHWAYNQSSSIDLSQFFHQIWIGKPQI